MKPFPRSLFLAVAVAAAAPLTAQTTPPADTVRIGGSPADTISPADTVSLGLDVPERAPEPSRWGTPFAVETSGTVAERPPRREVVWVAASAARAEARPSAPAVPPTDSVRPAPRPATPPRSAAASAPRPRTHTVGPGETFYGIARRYEVTSAALRAANPDARWENLRTGETLRIPAPAGGTPAATPARTGGTRPAAGSTPTRGRRTHTVERGETLFGLARRYGVPADSIRRANRLETDQVRIGQTLVIPAAP